MNLWKKLFYSWAYAIGCRKITHDAVLPCNDECASYDVLLPSDFKWFADPFCFYYNGKNYVFCEIFSVFRQRGTIGYTIYDGSSFARVREVLVESFHMSFPNLFSYNGKIYMIPETNAARQIRIYQAVDFPEKWELKEVLVSDIQAVDSTLLKISNTAYLLFTHDIENDQFTCRTFVLDMDQMTCKEITLGNVADARPAGNPIDINGMHYRILQDCSNTYGEKMLIYRIDNTSLSEYAETYIDQITVDNLPNNKKIHFNKTHTLTRSDNCEAVDYCFERFNLSKPIMRIYSFVRKISK